MTNHYNAPNPPSEEVPKGRRGSNHHQSNKDCHPGLDPGPQTSVRITQTNPENKIENASLNKQFPSSKFLFSEVTAYLQKFGRQTYGQHFTIIEEDYETIYKLLVYFYQDEQQADKLNIKLHKGILLTGPISCGKTTLMNLLKHIQPPHKQFVMVPTRKIAYEFPENGIKTIHKYTTQSFRSHSSEIIPRDYCFDDLGVETSLPHFGNRLNIMAEIILSRYDLFIGSRMLTHITSNLSAFELEELYGNRVRSRLREMMTLYYFKNGLDKRS